MCGLMGVYSPEIEDIDYDIFADLMIVSILRGYQGAGAGFVKKGGHTDVIKTNSTGAVLAKGPKFAELARKKYSVAFGHTRWPTRGFINHLDHVHPHTVGDIVGCHNGTMEHILGTKPKDTESDSKLLFQAIEKEGIKTTIEKSKGAYALVWINKKEGTLNFLRNYERTLYMGRFEGDDTLYWASEHKFLECVLSRRSDNKLLIESVPLDKHIRYPINFQGDIKPLDITEISRPWGGNHQSYWKRDGAAYGEGVVYDDWVEEDTLPFAAPPTEPPPLLPPPQPLPKTSSARRKAYGGYFNHFGIVWVSRERLVELLDKGCAYCGTKSLFIDWINERTEFLDKDSYACHKCLTNDNSRELLKKYFVDLPVMWPNNSL